MTVNNDGPQDVYEVHGLFMQSPFVLGDPEPEGGPFEVRIVLSAPKAVSDRMPAGEVLLDFSIGERRLQTVTDNGRGYVFRVHGLCDFMIDRALDRIECRPDPSAEPEQVALLLRGAVPALVLGLQGVCVLHGAVVEVPGDGGPDKSVAFVAGSGMGKSTTAAMACRDGALLVSDDLLRLDSGERPGWVGTSPELRLRPAAASLVDGAKARWPTHETIDGRLAARPPRTRRARGDLDAVVIPRPSKSDDKLQLDRLSPVEAAMALACFPRLTVWRSPSVLAAQFDGVARIADSLPVYDARIPWGPPFQAGLGARLFELAGVNTAKTVSPLP